MPTVGSKSTTGEDGDKVGGLEHADTDADADADASENAATAAAASSIEMQVMADEPPPHQRSGRVVSTNFRHSDIRSESRSRRMRHGKTG